MFNGSLHSTQIFTYFKKTDEKGASPTDIYTRYARNLIKTIKH